VAHWHALRRQRRGSQSRGEIELASHDDELLAQSLLLGLGITHERVAASVVSFWVLRCGCCQCSSGSMDMRFVVAGVLLMAAVE